MSATPRNSGGSSIKVKGHSGRKATAAIDGPPWAILQGKEFDRPGAPLLALLIEAANTRGIGVRELAEDHLGMSHSHFRLLRKGTRSMSRLTDENFAKIANFLKMPKVVAMLAGGQLKLEDFYQDPKALHNELLPALQFIQKDSEFGPHMPPSAFVADVGLQRFILLLYEKASGKTLIPTRSSLGDIIKGPR